MSAKKIADGECLTKELTIVNWFRLPAKAASLFVNTANRFYSDIFVEGSGERLNGKSIFGLLLLGVGPGQKVTLHVKGADASQAIAALEALVSRRFDKE